MVAMLPEAPLLIMAFCPFVGTAFPDQFPAVFQSVLLMPVQFSALAAERLMAARAVVTRDVPSRAQRNLGVLVLSFMGGLGVVEVVLDWIAAAWTRRKEREKITLVHPSPL
jgi:hypothetical protein